jgi:hypothetical protein
LAEKILTTKTALEGERKQVTVLFADLKGSMELLADRDPEEARQLLDPVLERMMAAAHRYEGMVNQVMGDGIIALFGAPIAHEDHAVRACYAALAMQTSVKAYAAEVHGPKACPCRSDARGYLRSGAGCDRVLEGQSGRVSSRSWTRSPHRCDVRCREARAPIRPTGGPDALPISILTPKILLIHSRRWTVPGACWLPWLTQPQPWSTPL